MDNKPEITRHGEKRLRKRVGVTRSASYRTAERAYMYGIDHDHARGRLRRYMEWLYQKHHGKADNIRIYNGFVFIFAGKYLLTTFPIPAEYRKTAQDQQKTTAE